MPRPELDGSAIDMRAHLAAIVDSCDDAILSKDLDGTILSWNKGAVNLYGYSEDEIVGRPVSVLVPDDRPDEVSGILAKLRRGERIEHFETCRVTKHGTVVQVSLTISPIRDTHGRIVAASTIARDITERIRWAQEAARIQNILSAAKDAVVGMDAGGMVTEWNPAAEDLLGWSADEAIGQRLSEIIIPERYREAHERGLRHYLETGEGPVIGQRVELEALHRGGHEIPIELAVFVTMTGGEQTFNAFIRDVSEHKRLTSELKAARDQALEVSRLKSEFLATMSHEIRTPLNGVIGMTGLLLDTELDSEQRDYADTVRRSGEALLTIINDILDFSKIEAGKLDLEIVDFDLRTVIEEVADLLAEQAHAKGLELATLVRPDVPIAVRGDPGRIRQVLTNLVGNAVKFTPAGEVIVHAAEAEEVGEDVLVRIEVVDTGIGISQELIPVLFEPFAQADSSTTRNYGGTGLGLAICRRLIDLMGGDISVDSEPGRGTTFAFELRLGRQPEGVVKTPARPDLVGLRTLIVDDNATNRTILATQVGAWGMRVTSVDAASQALDVLRAAQQRGETYDVGLIDMEMPGMDGLELARAIRADPVLAPLPLLLLTSSGVRGSAAAAQDAGFSASLTKPVRQSHLFDAIARAVGVKQRPPTFVARRTGSDTSLGSRPRLLVAEDNIVNQQVAVAMLSKLGYRADVVANGAEAVDAVSRIPYAAVLMDCQMPEMDGYAATAEIRQHEQEGQHLPIIALTAGAMSGDRDRCLAAGMDDYLAKPVTLEDLAAAMRQWIEVHEDDANAPSGSSRIPGADPFDADTVASLRKMMVSQPGAFSGLAHRFVEETARRLAAVREAVARADTTTIAGELHTITGAAATLGAQRLARACRRAHDLAMAEQQPDTEMITTIDMEFRRVAEWVRTQAAD